MVFGETIAAIATAPGRGGVAVVRVSGPDAFRIAERLGVANLEPGRVRFARLSCDEVVVVPFKAPHSYTGEDVVEFQGHGGSVSPRRVLEAAIAAGARLARRGEFTQRAFLNGKLDYDQAESVLDLVDAKTARAADAALEGLAGHKRRELKALYESALDLSTQLEHALDIDEGELPPDFLSTLSSQLSTLNAQLCAAIRRAREGKLLREGALVVLAGPPNAGKSSLMNALLEENRAIVSDVPGTTRDSIEEWLDLGGWPIRLVDTAGLRKAADEIEAEGVRRSEELLAKADLILWLGPQTSIDESTNRRIEKPSQILLHPKCDLSRGDGLNVSAKTGEGLDELKRVVVARLEERAANCSDSSGGQADELIEVLSILNSQFPTLNSQLDLVLTANMVRRAAEKLGSLIGATYSTDLLDNLFSRFCVGK